LIGVALATLELLFFINRRQCDALQCGDVTLPSGVSTPG